MKEAGYANGHDEMVLGDGSDATPSPIVDQINKWFVHVMPTRRSKFLTNFGGDPFINTPEKGQEMFLKAIDDWKEFVKIAKLPLM